MKAYKQASIPKGSVEIRFRGSKEDGGNFSAKFIIPANHAGQVLTYIAQSPRIKRIRNYRVTKSA